MSAFMNPYTSDKANGSAFDQANLSHIKQVEANNKNLQEASGIASTSIGGSMVDIPGQTYNGGISDQCVGSHCSIPITPLSANYINQNLLSANPPPLATYNYPTTNRLGNSSSLMPNIGNYNGSLNNPGPFNIDCRLQTGGNNRYAHIYNPKRNKFYPINSKKGLKTLKRFLKRLNT
jgi:hypothetical protein